MTRAEMRAVLASGGTVLHNGKHIRKEAELPSEADLAVASGTEGEALRSYQAQIAKLIAEKEALEKSLAEKEQSEKKKLVATKSETTEDKEVAKK